MSKPLKLALIMDNVLGWRTFTLNWKQHLPNEPNITPTWIVLTEDTPHWTDKVRGLPVKVRRRLRMALQIQQGLSQGPFDATYVSTGSALGMLPEYRKKNPCFLVFDSTVKQLYSFGEHYGWYPHRSQAQEYRDHQKRAAIFQAMRGLLPFSKWAGDSAVADYGASPQNVHVMPPSVDLIQWNPGDRAQRPDKEICDLLFVGGDFQRKGGDLLLQWAKNTSLTNWKLHLVTPHPVPNTDPRIQVYSDLTSNDPRLVKLYQNADAFVLPTQADCSSWAGIEALASGLPLVLGETGGTGEIVRAGETGFLIRPGDEAGLAQSLEVLIADAGMRRQMGAAARADAECRFDASKLVRKSIQIMKDSL